MVGSGTNNALWQLTPGSVTITRPQIIAVLPEWKPSVLQTASDESLTFSKDVLAKLTLGQRDPQIWVYIAEMTVELMAWLNVLWAYSMAVYLKHHMLTKNVLASQSMMTVSPHYAGQWCEDSNLLWDSDDCAAGGSFIVSEQPEGIKIQYFHQGMHIKLGEAIFQDYEYEDQMLAEGIALCHCESVTWSAPVGGWEPETTGTRGLWAAARCGGERQAQPQLQRGLDVWGVNH